MIATPTMACKIQIEQPNQTLEHSGFSQEALRHLFRTILTTPATDTGGSGRK